MGSVARKTMGRAIDCLIAVENLTFSISERARYRAPSESPLSFRNLCALRRKSTVERVSRMTIITIGVKPPIIMNWIQFTHRQPISTVVNAMVVAPKPVPKIAQNPNNY